MTQNQRWYLWSLLALLLCIPSAVAAEVIRDFSATYDIRTDGTVLVTERITYDFEGAVRHGIFRTLETDHPQPASSILKERYIEIALRSVLRDGAPEPYEVNTHANEVEVRIGDPDRTVTGIHTYELSYVLRGALSYGPEGAELYWNVTGHDWPVVIKSATIEITAPPGVLHPNQVCYHGPVGALDRCLASLDGAEAQRARFSSAILAPGEGVTVAQAINSAAVQELVVEKWQWLWIFIPGILIMLIAYGVVVYRRQTVHKPNAPIIAQYEPYGNLLPMYTGVVFDGRLDYRDIAAGIVYLAEQGFIKIRHVETPVLGVFTSGDYELTLLRSVEEAPNPSLQLLLNMIFSAPERPASRVGFSITFGTPAPTAVVVGESVLLSDIKRNAIANHQAIHSLQTAFVKQLHAEGYVEKSGTKQAKAWGSGIAFLVIVAGSVGMYLLSGSVILSLVVVPVVILGCGLFFMQRLTHKGYEARYHLLGFKDFLSVTDKERFEFHNAPELSPELFMKYLPYAIALNVEDTWANAFAGMLIPNPAWYDSGNPGAFSAAAFTADLATFSSSFGRASSGTSGSSGRGSSGGGGGGGGGGSW
jgi:uncharacterized membrane protein YgcG